MRKTSIGINNSIEGETIEMKIERVVNNREPISDGAETIYTERKDGVQAGYDIRTDRFEIAIEAMNKVASATIAKREAKIVQIKPEINGKPESTQATDN